MFSIRKAQREYFSVIGRRGVRVDINDLVYKTLRFNDAFYIRQGIDRSLVRGRIVLTVLTDLAALVTDGQIEEKDRRGTHDWLNAFQTVF